MKITDPEIIKNGEKDLIASVQEDLDPGTVREILKERLSVAALESRGGQIVVHDNEIAFRLDFEVNLSGSLLFDRDGNLLEEAAESNPETTGEIIDPEMELEPEEGLSGEGDGDEIMNDLQDIAQEDRIEDSEITPDDEPMENLSVDLPDYDLEEDLEEDLGDDLDNGLDEDIEVDLDAELEVEEEPGDEAPDSDNLDDDINDLLKESREFWAQKKNS